MDGPLGRVAVGIPGVSDETGTGLNVAVINGIAVEVGIGDVAVGLMTTGVAVKMEGVWVGGRNGVGGLPGGWMTQPLHDANNSPASITKTALFIFFSSSTLYPARRIKHKEEACGVVSRFIKMRKVTF
jgi:hypothetical protein